MPTDYYELLEVDRSASDDEIKRSYRRLARELHPDANGGDLVSEARFKEITVAYETLRDPERRRRYDLLGPDSARGGAGGPSGADGFGGGLGDLFDAFFGGSPFGGQRQGGSRRGDDVEMVLDLAFEEAVFGVERTVTLREHITCLTCSGSGAEEGTAPTRCSECAGSGQVRRMRQSILGQVVTTSPCQRCQGLGEIIATPCKDCRGEGRRLEDRSIRVEVPAGVDEGTTLRIPGAGGAPRRGGSPGDCYVHLRVARHERFQRAGSDLVTEVHIAFTQAALGTELSIETLDGTETIEVPAGTQSGRVVRLRGKGAPHVRGRGRGDLHVHLVVDTPDSLDKEQEQLLRQLAALRQEKIATGGEGSLFSRIRSSFG